jgi:hypothetical protein
MVFKRIISREGDVPWGETGMTSKKWLKVPVEEVFIDQLIATQPGVLLHALSDEYTQAAVGGDRYPHVIFWHGEYYLEDGHHRVVRTLLRGRATIEARVLTPPKRPAKMKVNEKDTRECGWMGCGNPQCEPVCAGLTRKDVHV